MSNKDKILIGSVIILTILISVCISVLASWENGNTIDSDGDLAKCASDQYSNYFMSEEIVNDILSRDLKINIKDETGYFTIAERSATCTFHTQGTSVDANALYRVCNVIDIDWNSDKKHYEMHGYWNGGNSVLTTNDNAAVDTFVQAMYDAYTNYTENYNTTTRKNALKLLFIEGLQDNGFLRDASNSDSNTNLNIDPNFIASKNVEGPSYIDDNDKTIEGAKNSGDLIKQYRDNNRVGYGITNLFDDNSITKSQDEGYTILGPMKIQYSIPNSITKVALVGEKKSWGENDGETIEWRRINDDGSRGEWSDDISKIESDIKFEVRVSDSEEEFYQSNEIKVKIMQKIDTYKGRMMLLRDIEKADRTKLNYL